MRNQSGRGAAAAAMFVVAIALTPWHLTAQSDAAPSRVEIKDATVGGDAQSFSDAVSLLAEVVEDHVRCSVTMARPIAAGMFTCVHLDIDCDGNDKTGIDGDELGIRAAVGSRYHPNSFRPEGDGKPAIALCRQSFTYLGPARDGGVRWLHSTERLPAPEIDGKTLRFRIPLRLIKDRGDRYGSTFAFRARVETSASDQPLTLARVCSDGGVPISVDGDLQEWSGVEVSDPGDELHPAARPLDFRRLRLEHGDEHLYCSVQFAAPGFEIEEPAGQDIERRDNVQIYFEPMFPRYQKPLLLHVSAGGGLREGSTEDGADWESIVGPGALEVGLLRKRGQNKFRVSVWSDYRRFDRFDETVRLSWAAPK